MAQTFAQVVGDRSWPVQNRGYVCPACGSWHMVPVVVDDERHRFCVACASCWDVHSGRARRVEPLTCAGCGREEECYDRLRREVPPFMWEGETIVDA